MPALMAQGVLDGVIATAGPRSDRLIATLRDRGNLVVVGHPADIFSHDIRRGRTYGGWSQDTAIISSHGADAVRGWHGDDLAAAGVPSRSRRRGRFRVGEQRTAARRRRTRSVGRGARPDRTSRRHGCRWIVRSCSSRRGDGSDEQFTSPCTARNSEVDTVVDRATLPDCSGSAPRRC